MAIFLIKDQKVQKVPPIKIGLERDIQRLFEKNLNEILNITFLASEYSTSFGGRIDSLGIDNNGAPVIIEYKKGQNENVITKDSHTYVGYLTTKLILKHWQTRGSIN